MIKPTLFVKLMAPIIVIFMVVSFCIAIVVPILVKQNAINDATLAAQDIVEQYKTVRSYYTQNVVKKVLGASDIKTDYDHADNPKKIPLPATLIHEVSSQLERADLKIKFYSGFPFEHRADRQLDAFEENAWNTIAQNPSSVVTELKEIDGQQVYRVAIADKMIVQACVDCHNSHPYSPKRDWQVGDVRGVLEVFHVIDDQLQAGSVLSTRIISSLMLGLMLSLLSVMFIYRKIVLARITEFKDALSTIADGGCDHRRLRIKSDDELDDLAHTYNRVAEKIDDTMTRLNGISVQIMDSAEILSQSAARNTDQLENQKVETNQVSDSFEQMKNTVQDAASDANEASQMAENAKQQTNTSLVSVDENRAIVEALSNEIQIAQSVISQLEQEGEAIGSVVDVIRNIAEQTNLLALNAAIEAARAGESGRGFAVVADEVRNLAIKTQESTIEIQDKIKNIRERTSSAAQVMENSVSKIESTVTCANDISTTINSVVNAIEAMYGLNNSIAGVTQAQIDKAQHVSDSLISITETTESNLNESMNVKASGDQLVLLSNLLKTIATEYQGGAGVTSAVAASACDDSGEDDILF